MSRTTLILAAAAALALVTVAIVLPGELAVRESYGGGNPRALGPGIHLRVLLYHRLYRYGTRPVTVDEPMEIVTKENASFKLPIKVQARVSPGDLLTFHASSTGRQPDIYIKERLQEALKSGARVFSADEILTGESTRRLGAAISADLISHGISDDGLQIGRPSGQVVLNAVADYLSRKLLPSARKLAVASLAADPDDGLCHAAMGMVLEAEGNSSEAEKEYRESLFLNPAAPEPMGRLYLLYQLSKDPEALGRLERLLEAAIAKKKDSAVHHDWLGQIYMRTGRPDKAEMAFKTAIGLQPKVPEFRISLGSLKAQQGKVDEARAAYEDALKIRPDHPLALFDLGVTFAIQNQLDKAIEVFHRAERAGQPSHALLNALAQAYEQKGQLEEAADYLKRSLSARPNQPDRQADLKRVLTLLKKHR